MKNNAKILVVDDSTANLELVTTLLSSVGYTVSTAISGERAINRLRTYKPDLILLDIQMPGMDGFETCRELKNNPDTAPIPVIFLTALSDVGAIVRGFSLGGIDYINKPFQELELLIRVKNHLQLHSLTQQLEEQVLERTSTLQIALEHLKQSRANENMPGLKNWLAGAVQDIHAPITELNQNLNRVKQDVNTLLRCLFSEQRDTSPSSMPSQNDAEGVDLALLRDSLPVLLDTMQGEIEQIQCFRESLHAFLKGSGEPTIQNGL